MKRSAKRVAVDALPNSDRCVGRPAAAVLVALGLAAVTIVLFLPTLRYEFVDYDERGQILDNPLIRSLGPAGIAAIFDPRADRASYYPVRNLSLAIDYRFWGLRPLGYHLTNILLHAANVLLVFLLLRRLMQAGEPASQEGTLPLQWVAAGALLFAVHPVVVEPVAWAAGREELLMVVFALLSVHAHLSAQGQGGATAAGAVQGRARGAIAYRTASVICCGLACLSSVLGTAVPLLWTAQMRVLQKRRWSRIVAMTGPAWLIALAVIGLKMVGPSGCFAIDATNKTAGVPQGEASPSMLRLTAGQRAATVLNTYRQNLTTLIWPVKLLPRYPMLVPRTLLHPQVLMGAATMVLTAIALWWTRRRRLMLFGLLWLLAALLPSAQFVPHHHFRADRFLYLPLVGVSLIVAAALQQVFSRPWSTQAAKNENTSTWSRETTMWVVAALVLLALAGRSVAQLPVWRDAFAFWQCCAEANPYDAIASNNLGTLLDKRGEREAAEEAYRRAIRLSADYPEAHSNLATLLAAGGDWEAAARHYAEAVRYKPDWMQARFKYGLTLNRLQRHAEAAEQFQRTVQLAPDDHEAWYHLGLTEAHLTHDDEAIAAYQRALQLRSEYPPALRELAFVLSRQGRTVEAVEVYRSALRVQPADATVANNLAEILATDRDPAVRRVAEAVQLAEQVCRQHPGQPLFMDTLAAAYAETGQFEQAIAVASEAERLAQSAGKEQLAKDIAARLADYRAGQPARSAKPATTSAPARR